MLDHWLSVSHVTLTDIICQLSIAAAGHLPASLSEPGPDQ